jgi:hypothetical protein
MTVVATSLPTYAQDSQQQSQQQSSPQSPVDLIGVGTSILNNIINPPHRATEINADAEVRKAKIAADAEVEKERLRIEASKTADKVTPILSQWGVSRINCAPGLVFINGITTDTVCIQPTSSITAGYYSYDSDKRQLIRNSTNVQTVQTVQSTTISTPAKNPNPGKGF